MRVHLAKRDDEDEECRSEGCSFVDCTSGGPRCEHAIRPRPMRVQLRIMSLLASNESAHVFKIIAASMHIGVLTE